MKYILENLKTAELLTFATVSVVVFFKNLLFHYSCFGYLAFSSLWTNPTDFFAFYFAKISPAIFIAAFVFIFKRKWWICVVSLLLDLWLISNMIYYRANGFFLDIDTIAMAGNMDGFWNSVWTYINWTVYAVPFTTVLLCVYCIFSSKISCVNRASKSWRVFAIAMVVVAVLGLYNWFWGAKNTKETAPGANDGWKYNFITAVEATASGNTMYFATNQWIESQSCMHFFPAMLYYYLYQRYYHGNNDISINEIDAVEIGRFIQERQNIVPSGNMVLIIGESFESWAIDLNDEHGNKIMPNLSRLSAQNNVLYCDKIKSQVMRGSSGDGQMIINTGLLPLASGAACMAYDENEYPNFAELFPFSFVINPCSNVWNQGKMTERYGYKKQIQNSSYSRSVGDSVALELAVNTLDTCHRPFCMQIITVTTHVPFDCGGRANMSFADEMPDNLRNYLNCMHYADSCIGLFLAKLENDSLMDNTTIVITGDHTIFKKSLLDEYQSFAEKYDFPLPKDMSYCPLIIYSSQIKNNIRIEDECYQMDIYPTITALIGKESYAFKGFGVNLLDSTLRSNRPVTEGNAYELSEKIIRSDFFKDRYTRTNETTY